MLEEPAVLDDVVFSPDGAGLAFAAGAERDAELHCFLTHVEEPMYAGANGALKMAHDMPEEYWKKLS